MWIETKAVFFILAVFGVTPDGMPTTHATLYDSQADCEQVGTTAVKLAMEQEWGGIHYLCIETPAVIIRETNS